MNECQTCNQQQNIWKKQILLAIDVSVGSDENPFNHTEKKGLKFV
jgi:hypothetical protein